MLKKNLKTVGALVLLLILFVLGFFWNDANSDKYDVSIAENKIPLFEGITVSNTMLSACFFFTLMFFYQIYLLKNHFTKQLN